MVRPGAGIRRQIEHGPLSSVVAAVLDELLLHDLRAGFPVAREAAPVGE